MIDHSDKYIIIRMMKKKPNPSIANVKFIVNKLYTRKAKIQAKFFRQNRSCEEQIYHIQDDPRIFDYFDIFRDNEVIIECYLKKKKLVFLETHRAKDYKTF